MKQTGSGKERFQRMGNFTEGAFEQDLLIMHRESQDTLMLNSTATAIWEALKWPQSVDSLVDLLLEAFPEQPREKLALQVGEVLKTLRSRGFLAHLEEL